MSLEEKLQLIQKLQLLDDDANCILRNTDQSGKERIFKAVEIAQICKDPRVWKRLPSYGLKLSGITIEGELKLEFTKIDIPLSFTQCKFKAPISLKQAKIYALEFKECVLECKDTNVPSIDATAANIEGDFDLSDISGGNEGDVDLSDSSVAKAVHEVKLTRAIINGRLYCKNGKINKLTANEIVVKGQIHLDNGFRSENEVDLSGSSMSHLRCEKGQFNKLTARGMIVKGHIRLDDVRAEDIVDFSRSSMSALICINATLEKGLTARGVAVKENVTLSKSTVNAEVELYGATIGEQLFCSGKFSKFKERKPVEIALNAGMIDVKSIVISKDFEAEGEVNFHGATVCDIECSGRFKNPEGDALSLEEADIKGNAILENFHAWGKISLEQAKVGKTLRIDEISGESDKSDIILDFQFAKIQRLEYNKKLLSLDPKLKLNLNGLVYESMKELNTQKKLDAKELTLLNHWLKEVITLAKDLFQPKLPETLSFLRLQLPENFSRQPYEQLAKVLKSNGNEEEATWVLISKEDDQLRQVKPNCLSWFWKQLLRVSISYGYRPQLSLLWGAIVVVIGAIIFNFGYKNALITPTTDSFTSKPAYFSQKDADSKDSCAKVIDPRKMEDCPKYPKFDPLIYSLDTFLPIIDLHLKGYWLPNANAPVNSPNIKWGYWLRVYFIVHTIFGWAIVTLAVAGFSGLVRRVD